MSTVSVIVPFYNRVPWAVEAVRSVLEGTYQDFEIVLVDDGSTEDSAPLQAMDGRIRYVRQENRGPAAARNRGLDLACGRYVAFLDSDDLFMPSKLERQVNIMDERPDVTISHTSYHLVSQDGEHVEDVRSGRYAGWVYPKILMDGPRIATPTIMVRRDALDSTARFREDVRYGEDTLLWVYLTKKSELVGIDEPLSKVRIHGGNAFLNLQATVEGIENVARYGVAADKDIPLHARRKILSGFYTALSIMYLEKHGWTGFVRYALRALVAWPFHRLVYVPWAKLVYDCASRRSGCTARRS